MNVIRHDTMEPPRRAGTLMSTFGFRRAPGVRWTPVLPFHGSRATDWDAPVSLAPMARGTRATACDLALPDAFALRREARDHLTPRSPVCCPLEATALRQWCVRLQREACPLQAQAAPVPFRTR